MCSPNIDQLPILSYQMTRIGMLRIRYILVHELIRIRFTSKIVPGAHPFAVFADGWDSIHYSSRTSVHDTSVRARLERLARDERSESRVAKSWRNNRSENSSLRRRPARNGAFPSLTASPGAPVFLSGLCSSTTLWVPHPLRP
jgi:hypothetical protein